MKNLIYDLVDKWCRYRYVDPVFSFAKICLKSGVVMLSGGVMWKFSTFIPELNIPVTIEFGPSSVVSVGGLLVATGLGLGLWRIFAGNKKVGCFLIYHKGMPGMELGDPAKALPGSCKTGEVRTIYIDYSPDKNEVLRKISSINDRIAQEFSNGINAKAELVYAGLAPIPFLFYAGSVISSRKHCKHILDWDRSIGAWHEPDNPRQDLKFVCDDPSGIDAEELAIAIPASVDFGSFPVEQAIGEMPIVVLKLPVPPGQDSVSSKHDQKTLAEQFYNKLSGLRQQNPRLKKVHLFIAAQASFVFCLGQQYTKGVHPPISIYNFNGHDNRYDWKLSIDGEVLVENMP